MTMPKLLLDTNAASALIRRVPEATETVSSAALVIVPFIVAGELMYGANHAPNPVVQTARVEEFLALSSIVFAALDTTRRYGRIRASLRARGQQIPVNDTWTAALALEPGLTLMTRDQHFNMVESVTVIGW